MRRFLVFISVLTIVCLFGATCLGQEALERRDIYSTSASAVDGEKTALPKEASGDWWRAVQQNIKKEEYHLSAAVNGSKAIYQAPNRAQGFRSYFTEKGLRVVPRSDDSPKWEWGLELVCKSKGRSEKAQVSVADNRIEYNRGNITEWYINDEKGLEHGFTIYQRESAGAIHESSDTLNIDMKLTGSLHPKFSEDGQAIDFYHKDYFNVLKYSQLKVSDAMGRILPSKFEGISGGIRIAIDDKNAVYPITVDPLATSPAWSADGGQESAMLGSCVGTAGDVNGDGYSDVIVGAWYYDTGQTDAGRVFAFYGSASGLSAAANWTIEGDQANAYFGNASTAGDVNGDGFSDVIVGASSYDNGQSDEGRAYVYHGSASGLSTTANWTAESDSVNAYFGTVSTAGDIDGDGYSDVIVGASNYEGEGKAYVYLGSASGLSAAAAWTAQGNPYLGDRFGYSVATAGDVNGDGYSDIIIGAMYYDNGQNNEGRTFVYHGSAAGLGDPGTPSNADWTAESNQAGAQFGISVSTAGDVNGDGYSDIIVGAHEYDGGQSNEGRAYVYHGSASGLSNTANWTTESDQASANYGYSVSTAGDINGDGYCDIIVGALFYDNGQADEGRAFVYLGSATGLSSAAAWTAESDQSGSSFGCSVATAGDVNGDGYSDVIAAARDYDNTQNNEGRAFVYHGSASGLSAAAGWTAEGNQASASFGQCVESAGDVNGDGYSDVIVGAYLYDNGQSNEGRVFVYLGSPTGLDTVAGWTAESNIAGARLGDAVSSAGDVNGDGFSDVIVGSREYDNGEINEGAAFLWYGSSTGLGPSGTPGNAGWAMEGGLAYSYFGSSIASAGDVNGDGFGDIVVGAYGYYAEAGDGGRAYLYHGSASGLSTTANWIGESGQDSSSYGYSVATAGDINGDGFSDVVIGAPQYDNGESGEGRAFLYYGSPAGLGAAADWTAESDQASTTLGHSVGTAGDVNGDGFSDLILGVPYYDSGITDGGMAFIWYGSASGMGDPGTPANADWSAWGGQSEGYFGWDSASAGDVNGDGYSDVMIGEIQYSGAEVYEGRACLYLGSASGVSSLPALTLEGNQEYASLGWGVASAGDVNGDGFSDVLIGAPNFSNGSSNEGAVFLHYGNGGRGLSLIPQQRRIDDTSLISHLGRSDSGQMFGAALTGRTPYGTGKFKLEWEVKPLGTLFDKTGTGMTADWQDTGVAGLFRKELVVGLTPDTVYHWRARLLYHPAATPFQQSSRWLTIPRNGWQEADLRTPYGDADLSVIQTDSPDPMLLGGGDITYTVTISNAGPDQAEVTMTDTLPPGMAFVSATPSQGSYSESGGIVTCELGMIGSGGSATVVIVVTPSSAGSFTNHSAVSSPAGDNNPGNNTSDETTTVNAPAIGNYVWDDTDADGIQDAGEPGMAGVVVKLYNSSYMWVNEAVTNSSGYYQFTGLTYGASYFIKVFLPSTGYSFSQPDQGGNDTLDSDVSVTTGQTPVFALVDGLDPSRWDAGMVYGITCEAPDEPVWIYLVTLSVPDGYPILNIQDPNQPTQRTGYHIRRSDDPSVIPKAAWPLVATNVVDMDAATPNIQWTDTSGAIPPSGTWYYLVTAYNSYCPAEGPFSSE